MARRAVRRVGAGRVVDSVCATTSEVRTASPVVCVLPHRVHATPSGCVPLCRLGVRHYRVGRCGTGSIRHSAGMCATPPGSAPLCQDGHEVTGCARHAIWHVASMLCTKCRTVRSKIERRSRSNKRRKTAKRSGSVGVYQLRGNSHHI